MESNRYILYIPSLLRSKALSEIYKLQGDSPVPSNNRPVCLISVFRKLIAASLTRERKNCYPYPKDLQLSHRTHSATECALVFDVSNI